MSSVIEHVSGRPFIDGVVGTVIDNGYFYCLHKSCPFSLRVILEKVGGMNVVVGVKSVMFQYHNHDKTKKSRVQVKKEMREVLGMASVDPNRPECVAFEAKCQA